MEDTKENISVSKVKMLEICRSGGKSESVALIQSEIDEIENKLTISKADRKKINKLKNLILEIGTNKDRKSNDQMPEQPSQNNNNFHLTNNNVFDSQGIMLPPAVQPMSNFLLYLKRALDWVEKIGKAATVNIINQKINDIKADNSNNYQREINCHKKILNILSREDSDDSPPGNDMANKCTRVTNNITKNKKCAYKKNVQNRKNGQAKSKPSSQPKIETDTTMINIPTRTNSSSHRIIKNDSTKNIKITLTENSSSRPIIKSEPTRNNEISATTTSSKGPIIKTEPTRNIEKPATTISLNKPIIKTEPTKNNSIPEKKRIKIENTENCPYKVRVKQEVIDID